MKEKKENFQRAWQMQKYGVAPQDDETYLEPSWNFILIKLVALGCEPNQEQRNRFGGFFVP